MRKVKNVFIFIGLAILALVLVTFGSGLWLGLFMALKGLGMILLIGLGAVIGWFAYKIFKKKEA